MGEESAYRKTGHFQQCTPEQVSVDKPRWKQSRSTSAADTQHHVLLPLLHLTPLQKAHLCTTASVKLQHLVKGMIIINYPNSDRDT